MQLKKKNKTRKNRTGEARLSPRRHFGSPKGEVAVFFLGSILSTSLSGQSEGLVAKTQGPSEAPLFTVPGT